VASGRASRRKAGRNRSSGSHVLRICTTDGLGNPRWVTADLVDHSEAGIGVSLTAPLKVGSRVAVTGKFGEGKRRREVERRVRVAWCLEKLDGSYRAGLELEDGDGDSPFADHPEEMGAAAPPEADYYEILQLSPNAEPETIHRVYRLLAQRFHPDNAGTGDAERFKSVLEAYRVLSDPERRAAYDVRWRGRRRLQWKIFDQKGAGDGMEEEQRKRKGILSLLYTKRMREPDQPVMTIHALEDLLGCPREHLEFSLWYLKEKGWVHRSDRGGYSITAAGVEQAEDNGLIQIGSPRMLTSGEQPGG